MSDEAKVWSWFIGAVLLALVTVIAAIHIDCHLDRQHDEKMAEMGYTQKLENQTGRNGPEIYRLWVKEGSL